MAKRVVQSWFPQLPLPQLERYFLKPFKANDLLKLAICSGGSRISQKGVPTLAGGGLTYYLVKYCRKLHENERNWTEMMVGVVGP